MIEEPTDYGKANPYVLNASWQPVCLGHVRFVYRRHPYFAQRAWPFVPDFLGLRVIEKHPTNFFY